MTQPPFVSPRPEPQDTRVVVSDVHADHRALLRLLQEVGAVDERGERNAGFFVLQLGDLAHLGHGVGGADAAALRLGRELCDVVLCGNHELFFAHHSPVGFFAGMNSHLFPAVQAELNGLVRAGQLGAAYALDEWLCTHAGVHPAYQDRLSVEPAEAAAELNERFWRYLETGLDDPLLSSIGPLRSAGRDQRPGGIFWCDTQELVAAGVEQSRWPQIIGHTPQPGDAPRRIGERLWCNDVGAALSGRLAALVRQGSDGGWRPVCVRSPSR